MSLDTGQFSDDWRMAYFVPVYKIGDKCSSEDYRTVSITSFCSNVLEHVWFTNIMQHLDKNSILMDVQNGFRKKHSCENQLIIIIVDMACNLFSSTQIEAVFLDFAKAVDNVPHQYLLDKPEYYGIRSK